MKPARGEDELIGVERRDSSIGFISSTKIVRDDDADDDGSGVENEVSIQSVGYMDGDDDASSEYVSYADAFATTAAPTPTTPTSTATAATTLPFCVQMDFYGIAKSYCKSGTPDRICATEMAIDGCRVLCGLCKVPPTVGCDMLYYLSLIHI